MLFRRAALVLAALFATAAVAQDPQSGERPAIPATDKNKLSYAIGYELGSDFREKSADIDVNTVIRAIQDAAAGRNPTVPAEEMRANLMAFQARMREEAVGRLRQVHGRGAAGHQVGQQPVHLALGLLGVPVLGPGAPGLELHGQAQHGGDGDRGRPAHGHVPDRVPGIGRARHRDVRRHGRELALVQQLQRAPLVPGK